MQYRLLGQTNWKVSVIGFGGASLSGRGGGYSFGEICDEKANRLVKHALARGINLYDTAPLYGQGLSEKRLGASLKNMREKVFIISKCGITWKDSGRIDHHNDPKICGDMLDQSLRRLQSDYIDLYMVHHPDPKVDIRFTVEVLAKAQMNKKINFIGLSNTNAEEIALAQEITPIHAIQNEYNFFATKNMESLKPLIKSQNIGFIGYGTLDKGILTGRTTLERTYDSSDIRSWAPWLLKNQQIKKKIQWVKKKHLPKLKKKKISPSSFALNYALKEPLLCSALCGFRSEKQLDDLLEGLVHA